MNKKIILLIVAAVILSGMLYLMLKPAQETPANTIPATNQSGGNDENTSNSSAATSSDAAQTPETQSIMSEAQATAIAEATCIKGGEALGPGIYNENSKTWWFDANLNAAKPGCNPACVVSADTKTAEINWRCTGAILPGQNNPATSTACTMEAKICPDGSAVGRTGPNCEFASCPETNTQQTACTAESRKGDVCNEIYSPVCATVQIQCVKAPCDPIRQTYPNSCEACHNQLVSGYIKGECTK
ncbi:MAG: hypothetical protein WA093_02075 [Minisyncoccales bacterium]